MKIKGPFVKLIMFDEAPIQLQRSFVQTKTQNQNIQWLNLDFSTSILVIKHNLPLKWHHIAIYRNNQFEHGF